jgi:pyrroloquinoline-quinone synthase
MDFWHELGEVGKSWDVLKHPFYLRWSAGELSRDELGLYAGQYRHAVCALAEVSRQATMLGGEELGTELARHAREEEAHVRLWDQFAEAVDAQADAPPTAETAACVRAWQGSARRSLTEALVTLYVIESAQPRIAETKHQGLLEHYGIAPGAATEYFDVHATVDHKHAAAAKAMIERRIADEDAGRLLEAGHDALSGNWMLLDGVEHLRELATPTA